MDAIKLLMEEHVNIKRMLIVIRKMAERVLEDQAPDYNDYSQAVDFVRSYADVHHHMKEEKVLFRYMKDELSDMIGGSLEGMIIEHNLGRMYIANLEQALKSYESNRTESRLEIIANAIGYSNLLNKHIDKEDLGLYMFAQKNLSEEAIAKLNDEVAILEVEATEQSIQAKYLEILLKFEEKYLD